MTTSPLAHLGGHLAAEECAATLEALPIALSFARINDQVIVHRNQAFRQLFGYEPAEFKTIYDWFDAALPFPEDVALTLERWGPLVAGKAPSDQPVEPMEVRILCKNGTIKNILHGGIVMPQANCVLATFVDLSTTRRDRPSPMVDVHAARAVDAAARLLPKLPPPQPSPSPWENLFVERRRQNQALRRSAELLDRTGSLAGVGGWEVDLLTDAVTWTDETRRMHAVPNGFQPDLQSALAFYTSDSRHLIRNAIEQTIGTGDAWDVEAQITRADGLILWVRTRGFVEFAEGKPVRLFGAIQDITSRVRREEALKSANERLVLATESGQMGIFDWDMVNDVAVWDDRMYRLYGLDPAFQNASYATWLQCIHPEDLPHALEQTGAAVRTGMPYADEYRVVWTDETVHHIRCRGRVLHSAEGVPLRFNGVIWDVTEQRRLATEHAHQEELFRTTLESIAEGVITTDAQTRVRWMNPVAERLTGWTIAEAAGLRLTEIFHLIHEETRQPIPDPASNCLALKEASTGARDTILIARDTVEVGINTSVAPIRDAPGNILGVVLVFHDVTVQRRLAREAQRVLQADLQMKDHFLSHVSHELRSPLASIYSFASILADGLGGNTTAEQDEYLEIILRNSRQLRAMIDDLLQVTRSETGKLSILMQPTSLAEAIVDAVNTTKSSAATRGVTLTALLPDSLPLVGADPTRLRQILIILLDNATKFTSPDGSVQVTVAHPAANHDLLEVCVADTGCGIDQALSERIFEHLYQVEEPGREGRKGLGLGLYIARDLVLRQGGTIWVESEVGKGSRFRFTLPIDAHKTSAVSYGRRRTDRPSARGNPSPFA